MDFTLGEELEAVRDLARQVFTDRATQERIKAAEESVNGFDEDLWKELGETGLLGVALPEPLGGAGIGAAGLAVLLEEQGRTVAPVPIWPAVVAALTIATHGTAAQRRCCRTSWTGRPGRPSRWRSSAPRTPPRRGAPPSATATAGG